MATSTPQERTKAPSRPPTATSYRQAPSQSRGPCTEANHTISRMHHTAWNSAHAAAGSGTSSLASSQRLLNSTSAGMALPAHAWNMMRGRLRNRRQRRKAGHLAGSAEARSPAVSPRTSYSEFKEVPPSHPGPGGTFVPIASPNSLRSDTVPHKQSVAEAWCLKRSAATGSQTQKFDIQVSIASPSRAKEGHSVAPTLFPVLHLIKAVPASRKRPRVLVTTPSPLAALLPLIFCQHDAE
jgi:hypothetical protein